MELKTCPFCGGSAYVDVYEDDYRFFVSCVFCGARTDSCTTEKEAIESWNNRV